MLSLVVLFLGVSLAGAVEINGYPTVPLSEFNCSTVDDPSVDKFYPNPNNCNEFYRCVPLHTNAYLYTCNDPAEVYDDYLQMCVNTWDVYPPCGTKQSTTVGTGPTGSPPTSNPDAFKCDGKEYGYYPNPDACNSFYICNSDVLPGTSPDEVPCPSGLIWNPDVFYCDWAYNVPPPCGTMVVRRVPFDENIPGPACDDSERYNCNGVTIPVVDSSDCSVFYNCDANIQLVCPSRCPDGLEFDEALGVCNWAYLVQC